MKNRIIFNIVFIAIIVCLPWWVAALVALVGAFIWSPYYEVIGFGVMFDLLYGADTLLFGGIFGLIISLVIFMVGSIAKKIVR